MANVRTGQVAERVLAQENPTGERCPAAAQA